MQKLLATALCSLPLVFASAVYAQGGTTTPENRLPRDESPDSSKNMGSTLDGRMDNTRMPQDNRTGNMNRPKGDGHVPPALQDGSPKNIEQDRDQDGVRDIKPAGSEHNRGSTHSGSSGMSGSSTR